MKLTPDQAQHFHDYGYVKIEGGVSQETVNKALRRINNSLGKGFDAADAIRLQARSSCPELQTELEIMSLYRGGALDALTQWAFDGNVHQPGSAQLAIRYPSLDDVPKPPRPHVDGTYSEHNGVQVGTLHSFSALCAVFLSPISSPFNGNFTVWPGTHLAVADFVRREGINGLIKGMPDIALPEPVQINARPGDVVLAHYLLAHAAAQNIGPSIRYAAFYRVAHTSHADHREAALRDPWLEWGGLRHDYPDIFG
ncbi:MAG TPA: phytanoyl-CoA dioxygenase family protein [Capsulimonadaceae bacterium]|jgi:hypothetical protein